MKHIPALDGLRAVAIAIVLVSHFGLGHVVPGGFGVTVFFVLSGYLITTILRDELVKTGSVDFRQFYLRRVVRIIPPMWFAILFGLALTSLGLQSRPLEPEYLWTDLLFLTNYAGSFGMFSGTMIPLWSLDVEEHFYLFFPLLLLATFRRQPVLILASICVVVLLLRIALALEGVPTYYGTHTRIDSILFGCILALWRNPIDAEPPSRGRHFANLLLAAVLILPTLLYRDEFFRETVRHSMQGLGLFFAFTYCIQDRGWISGILGSVPLRWLAFISYTLYLVHLPVLGATQMLVEHPVLSIIVALVVSLAISQLVRVTIEKPMLRLRKNFEAKRSIYLKDTKVDRLLEAGSSDNVRTVTFDSQK
ncbi:acyltransferase family protein [Altererythrobacter aurantiacus]|uniref:Acyltransferase family protein n=1 Tax=Parapontixanthobacter aurantiacus TaxID=1463599 RepID=A0A844ZD75_9SPHN|nr:acyltransferase family protein [Parapontixanthobacter aurantiacus]